MIRPDFNSDYECLAHPLITDALVACNNEHNHGYGFDPHSEKAVDLIRKACGDKNSNVYFFSSGTQTNAFAISIGLKPYEGIMSARTGHIMTHEAGAVEATGHKVLPIIEKNGIVSLNSIKECVDSWENDSRRYHMVKPGMIYLTQPTELGTQYSLQQLKEIYSWCHSKGIFVFIDGARLGYGLTSSGCDYTLADIAQNCDLFYIGGTKCGLMMGEALVITNPSLRTLLFPSIKRFGAMLAKGFLIGIQFEAAFTPDRNGILPYFSMCKQANDFAEQLSSAMKAKGFSEVFDSNTNQRFFKVPFWFEKKLERLADFSVWDRLDDEFCLIRFVTSWATNMEEVNYFIQILLELTENQTGVLIEN